MRARLSALGPVTARRLAREEDGVMLMELLIAMVFLAVAVGAMLTVFASSMVSLRNAGIEGTALTLAESQMENYKTLPYAEMMLSSATIPGGSDAYSTANAQDSTIPSSSGVVTGGTTSAGSCTAPARPLIECAVQTVTGPDGRAYRIDTYVHESGGLKSVTVVTRVYENGAVGRVKARATTAFDPAFTVQS